MGIAALPVVQAQADARKIFAMVTEDRGSTSDLRQLIRHDSVYELIGLCIDLTIATRPVANGVKSRRKAVLARAGQVKILHDWLERNLWRYKRQLDLCAFDAHKAPGITRSYEWVRREISAYRRSQKHG